MTSPLPRPLLLSLLAIAWLAALPVACSGDAPHSDPDAHVHAELWTCGMHPDVLEGAPGACPICGMDLTPLSPATSEEAGPASATDGPVPGTIRIDPVITQNMGVRVAPVERQPLFRHLRTIGEVVVGEDRVSVVNLRFSGWIEVIRADRTGEYIEAGQPLFEIYSPELVAAQEDFLLALRTQGARSELTRSARRKLALFDLAQADIDGIAETGRSRRSLTIRAPRAGYILEKNVVEGARVGAGQDLYRIGDLSRVWVHAEVYEHDAPWVEVGQPAEMELAYQRGVLVPGSVSYVYPTLNEGARTLTVRLEFPNPDLRLKPGMFATVHIAFRRIDDALVLPSEAILHSGKRELVFVALGDGRFAPREITTGLVGDRHMTQVLSGLEAGELVVTSGQFLIDSESQLQEAIAKMLARRAHGGPGPDGDIHGPTVYACPMHPEERAHGPGRCAICGMDRVAEEPER